MVAMQPIFSRHIRSFVMRSGHITEGQKSARDRLLAKWSIPYQAEPVDFKEVFQRDGSIVLEIGFGMGESTATVAQSHPEWNIVGVEVYRAGVGALLAKIEKLGLGNVRIIEHDAVEVIDQMIQDASLDAVHIYFPDPWPKKRHHKRRLIQSEFIARLAPKIRPGGIVHMATDWPEYAEQMLAVCSAEPLLVNLSSDGYCPRPAWRPMTKFESRGLRLGHPVADLIFQKR